MATTTVRVRTETRDELLRWARERHQSADEVISSALAALHQMDRRRRAQEDAARLAADPVDRAEVEAVQRDLEDVRAW